MLDKFDGGEKVFVVFFILLALLLASTMIAYRYTELSYIKEGYSQVSLTGTSEWRWQKLVCPKCGGKVETAK